MSIGVTVGAAEVVTAADHNPIPHRWDEWLHERGSQGGFCQSSIWAEINTAANAVTNHWIEVTHGKRRIGAALLSHARPRFNRLPFTERLKIGLSGAASGWLDCFDGPVLTGPDKHKSLAGVLAQVDALALRLGVRTIRFNGMPPLCDWRDEECTLDVFHRFGYRQIPYLTALVDLRPSEKEIFRRFKHAARKGIRSCERAGVKIVQCRTRDDFLGSFVASYYDDVHDDADAVSNESRSLAMWEIDADRHYRFFVAKDADGRVLATLGTYSFNGLATEIMSHRTRVGIETNLPAQDLLHWEVFKAHKAAGDSWFNLAGYSPAPTTPKEVGIRRFKEKWGGQEVSVPRLFKSFPSLAQRVWHRLRSTP